MSTEEKKVSSLEIEEMLKEAEEVHTARRKVNEDRKKKPKIRIDRVIALVVALVAVGCAIWGVVTLVENNTGVNSPEVKENPLLCEQYPEISDVVKNYMEAYLIEDPVQRHNVMASYVDNMGEISESDILKKEYVDGYSEFECYTKNGPYENTYVVYAYYQMELKNIATTVPNITRLYVIRDSNTGNVYIHNGVSSEISEYMDEVTTHADVQELFDEVNKEFDEALASSDRLREFFNKLQETTVADTTTETTVTETTVAPTVVETTVAE